MGPYIIIIIIIIAVIIIRTVIFEGNLRRIEKSVKNQLFPSLSKSQKKYLMAHIN